MSKKVQAARVGKYMVGEVVVTNGDIATTTYRGVPGPKAAPGWLWRVEEVIFVDLAAGYRVRYRCVAHEAPTMFSATIAEKKIARMVGVHKG